MPRVIKILYCTGLHSWSPHDWDDPENIANLHILILWYFLIQEGGVCYFLRGRKWVKELYYTDPCACPLWPEYLGTRHCKSRLPDKWPCIDLVTGIPRRWFPAWFLCIQLPVYTYWSSNAHPLVPGSPVPPASLLLPKASHLVLISELGLGEGCGCLCRKDSGSVSTRGKKIRSREPLVSCPTSLNTPWLLNSIRIYQWETRLACWSPLCIYRRPRPSSSFQPGYVNDLPGSHSNPSGRKAQGRGGEGQSKV